MNNWIINSNRWKHFLYAIPLALVLTVFAAIGCAGGIVGQALQVLIIYLIIKQQP